MKWFLQRLSEPSSAASISGLAAAVSGSLYAGMPWQAAVAAALPAVFGFVMKEKANGEG